MGNGSMIWRVLSALLFGGVTLVLLSPLMPAPEPGDNADEILAGELERERQAQEAWLRTSATSILAATARVPFDGRASLSVGAATDNDVRLDEVSDHHLRITLRPEGYYAVEALDPGATLAQKDQPMRSLDLRSGSFQVGRFTLSLSPAAAPVLLVSDPRHPKLASFAGLQHFPIDRELRVVAPLVPVDEKTIVELAATKGTVSAEQKGWFALTLGGVAVRLEVHRLLSPSVRGSELVVLFRDATSGEQTSALGRQVEPLPLPDGRYLLDFNRAVHSACVHSEHYQCALAPEANTLPVAVTAGERLPAAES